MPDRSPPPPPPGFRRRFPSPQLRHHELREAHVSASDHLTSIDVELEAVIARRKLCLAQLADLRTRLNRRYTDNHIRRRHHVDEAPMPPAPAGAESLESIDLRSVCLAILRRHGPQRLRDLHGLLHCYGYAVGGVRPVQRLGDAMAYEERRGRARRVARGTYEAVADAPVPPRPGWWGPSPEPGPQPLPWSRPETHPGPPLVDPRVADDPELWSGRSWPDPPAPPASRPDPSSPDPQGPPAPVDDPAPPDADEPAQDDLPAPPADGLAPAHLGDDSLTNRPQGRGEQPGSSRARAEQVPDATDPGPATAASHTQPGPALRPPADDATPPADDCASPHEPP